MATPDPCAALFGSVKQACENMGKTLNGSGGSGGSGGGGILGSLLGPFNTGFDFRHFMIRVAEFGVGALLVVIAADALIKSQVMPNPVVQSGKRLGKKAFK